MKIVSTFSFFKGYYLIVLTKISRVIIRIKIYTYQKCLKTVAHREYYANVFVIFLGKYRSILSTIRHIKKKKNNRF